MRLRERRAIPLQQDGPWSNCSASASSLQLVCAPASVEPPLQPGDDLGEIVVQLARVGECREDLVIVGGTVADAPLAVSVDLELDELGEHRRERALPGSGAEAGPDLVADRDASHVVADV